MKNLLLFSSLPFTVCAFAHQQYTFTNYTRGRGLPSGTVSGIYNDTSGYVWLTSEGALARLEGYPYKTYRYNPDLPTGSPSTAYREAAFPKYGDIYFGDKESNISFNSSTEAFSAPFGKSEEIIYVHEAKGGKDFYWMRSKDAIYRISKTDTERFTLPIARPMDYKK